MEMLSKTEEMIYPAACSHPTLHRLSETDQKSYPISQIFLYKQGPPSSQVLKSSLSKTLAFFYPVAGRLVERSLETTFSKMLIESAATCPAVSGSQSGDKCPGAELDSNIGVEVESNPVGDACRTGIGGRKDIACLDQGVLFLEAWTASQFDTFLPDFQPHPDLLALLPPLDPKYKDVLLKVQVTNFACGGMCLGVVYLHNIFDATSCAHFMECWVELANGKECLTIPPYISHTPLEIMYMPREPSSPYFEYSFQSEPQITSYDVGGIKNKIFHFTPMFIDTLKSESSDETCKYSSFECIAAFMWRNVTLARGICGNEELSLLYPVDGRRKLKPSLPPSYFGNVVFDAKVVTTVGDLVEKKLSHTMNLIREASSKVTDEHIRKVLKWSTNQSSPMPMRSIASRDVLINTWTRLPSYGFNFGWGNPFFCGPRPYIPFDYVGLLPSSLGKGHIEVIVALKDEYLQKLESLIS